MKIFGAVASAVTAMVMADLNTPMVSAPMMHRAGGKIQTDGGKSHLNNTQWSATDSEESWSQVFDHSEYDMGSTAIDLAPSIA